MLEYLIHQQITINIFNINNNYEMMAINGRKVSYIKE